ncbi:DNA/RNA non-specific endonuclease [Telluribacter sp. SYSU D00476]|uniref:DNA/RNA non-specific endonuclease n=1 Tax=Telluribacter sp. SYSU D00476 TaxID=2811430 RepID=UPI001FF63FB6|nr:DNA/RNA non-specific endonuclease [Telluribacter sp. SYSU D00476]
MSKVFISYRRSDAPDTTERIYDHLIRRYSNRNVFKDVDSMTPGVDFRTHVKSTILNSKVMLVIIGRHWLDTKDDQGKRRLDDPEDYVRVEIETALATPMILVIPVLVVGASIPSKASLPASLQPLIYNNACSVRPDPDFRDDLQDLIKVIDLHVRFNLIKYWSRLSQNTKIVGIGGFIVVASIVAFTFLNKLDKSSTTMEPISTNVVDTEEPSSTYPFDTIIPYNTKFIGKIEIPLPVVTNQISAGDLLDGKVFDYIHYSLVMDERRAMPLYTAYNIDREKFISFKRNDKWMVDDRIPKSLQTDSDLYRSNDWDRGHMVPRRAVMWGDSLEATQAALSTFFYSNTIPQHQNFNQNNWYALENYVISELRPESKHVSVFAGPVNRITDIEYRGRRIPQSFWMIAVVSDENDSRHLFAYAYLMDQYTLQPNERFTPIERIQDFNPEKYQVSVAAIEAVTPLRFGILKDFDTLQNNL